MPAAITLGVTAAMIAVVVLVWVAFRLGERRARQAASELSILNEIGRQLLSSRLNVDDLCELVYQQAGQVISTCIFQLGLFEDDCYNIKVWVRDGERLPQKVFPQGGKQGIVGWVRSTGEPLLVHDFEAERDSLPAFPEFDLDTPPQSGLFVPLIAEQSTIGLIAVQSRRVRHFTQEHLRLLTALANQAAWAIQNAQLYETVHYRAEQLRLIGQVTARISAVQPQPDLLRQIVTLIKKTFGYYCVSILIFEGDRLVVGESSDNALPSKTSYVGPGMIGWAAEKGETALANDVAEDHRYQKAAALPETQSEIALPLKVENRVLGVLDVQSDRLQAFSGEDVDLLETLASQIALAIEQAQVYEAKEAEAWVSTALLQVAEAVNAQILAGDALKMIVRLTTQLTDVSRCMIMRWDPEADAYLVNAHDSCQEKHIPDGPIVPDENSFLASLRAVERPLGAGEGYPVPIPSELAPLFPEPSIMGFPLRAKNELLGVLIVDDPLHADLPDPRKMAILTGIAHQAANVLSAVGLQAVAVERDRLEQELAVARNIQSSLIPDAPPQEPGWQIATTWRAARQVGGDFFDFIPLRDNRWGLVMADVADKGVPAALFMAMCRTLLRAVAISHVAPASTLQRVNELLFNDSRSDLFVTVFYAVWEPSTGRIEYANGGHNPSVLIRSKDKKVTELSLPGIALGVIPDIKLDQRQLTLKTGDVLVAYTDGITEAMQADYTEWGMDRFKAALHKRIGQPAEDMLSGILSDIDDFVGGAPQSDDLTIWFLRRQ